MVSRVESHRVVEASVFAGGVETVYRRAGQGPCVVLLGGCDEDEGMWTELFHHLSRRFRVIRPALPVALAHEGAIPVPIDPGRWLREFLEGLGLERPTLLMDPPAAAALASIRIGWPDRFDRWIVVAEGGRETFSMIEAQLPRGGDPLD